MNRDEVVGPDEEMVLAHRDIVLGPIRLEDDDEVVVGVFVDFRPLVLVLDVLDGQWVELERLLQELEIVRVRRFDIEPEAEFGRLREAADDLIVRGGLLLAGGGDEGSQGFLTMAYPIIASGQLSERPNENPLPTSAVIARISSSAARLIRLQSNTPPVFKCGSWLIRRHARAQPRK